MTDHTNPNDTSHSDGTDLYRHSFDPATDSVSEELVHAVAEKDDADPTELAILSDVVDPDALNSVFQTCPDGQSRTTGQVVLQYDGYPVEISADGTITVGSDD